MSDLPALARSASAGNKEDFLTWMTEVHGQLQMLNAATGNNFLAPTNSPQQPSSPPPGAAQMTVTGANGAYVLSLANAKQSVSAVVYHEVSYSTLKSFTQDVTTLEPSSATNVTVPAPGANLFFRVRSSFDKANWNSHRLAATEPVAAGLQTSQATAPAVVLNQSNYSTVDAVAAGTTADIRVYGPAGPRTMWPGVKGTAQTVYPSATIVNATLGQSAIVGFQDGHFMAAKDLPEVFADDVVPVGKVGAPGSTAITLPTVTAEVTGDGVTGFTVTGGGANLSAPVTLTIGGPGTGATAGAQTITGGVLTAVAAGAAGAGYTAVPTVTASGGVTAGTPGGGTAIGGNGGRLTNV